MSQDRGAPPGKEEAKHRGSGGIQRGMDAILCIYILW
jgi:hypothetical protein